MSSTGFAAISACCSPGLDWLEAQTGKPVLGVVPYLHGLYLDAEDMLPGQRSTRGARGSEVIVPALPRISNHTDFDALRAHPQVDFAYVRAATRRRLPT